MFTEMLAAAPAAAPNELVTAEDRLVDRAGGSAPIPIRIYAPTEKRGDIGALLWMHGGGFVLGGLDRDNALCERIVEAANCVVVSVDYRLAPEHPFPSGVDDCYEILLWLAESASWLGINPRSLAVGGASAGGALAAAVSLMARDRGGPALALQLLIYPMLDDRNITPSSYAATDPRVFNRASSLQCWKAYLPTGTSDVSPYAAPARASDLAGLPPAYLMVAEHDPLCDEDQAYARRLIEAGVRTEVHVYPGTFHGFDFFAPTAAVSRRATADYLDAVKRALMP